MLEAQQSGLSKRGTFREEQELNNGHETLTLVTDISIAGPPKKAMVPRIYKASTIILALVLVAFCVVLAVRHYRARKA